MRRSIAVHGSMHIDKCRAAYGGLTTVTLKRGISVIRNQTNHH
jgi:hypothetical protein